MGKAKNSATEKSMKALKINRAYAEYKMRHAGDLDGELNDWVYNITRSMEIKKVTKRPE